MKLAITAAALTIAAAPALAQECMPAAPALENMAANGYTVTFGDTSGAVAKFLAENGKGGWVLFILKDETLCAITGGEFGVHAPTKPNA